MELITDAPTTSWLDAWMPWARERLLDVRSGNVPGDQQAMVERVARALIQGEHEVWRVATDAQVAGYLWVRPQESSGSVIDFFAEPEAIPEAARLLADECVSRGWASLMLSESAGDAAARHLREHSDAVLVATKMSLDPGTAPAPQGIELRPMSSERFERYLRDTVDDYVDDLMAAGDYDSIEDAREESRQTHDELLPEGLATPDNLLWSAYTPGDPANEVGILWLDVSDDHGFIYDLVVDPDLRGKGYGTQMLRAAAQQSHSRGLERLWLNVFGHNADAKRLYERSGYVVNESIWMLRATGDGVT